MVYFGGTKDQIGFKLRKRLDLGRIPSFRDLAYFILLSFDPFQEPNQFILSKVTCLENVVLSLPIYNFILLWYTESELEK